MNLGRFTLAGYAIGLLIGIGLIVGYGAIEVSGTPAFCGSCHIMEPYYDSWKDSSHAAIACVDCHIPPGITAELRKKYEAMAMVARYFTATWGTRPWTEVEDAACLQCHERRLLVGREVYGDVLFDHGPHLSGMRRGKKLRCTSCHSQIVQGSHIAVTATTCILCHFKGQRPGEGTARCTLCHQVPDRIVDAGGLQFDHGDVSRFGMDCQSCHSPPGPGEGAVPKERCQTCHSEPARLVEYDNDEFLHRTHVTDHKVECTHCHLEIEHVAPRHLETAQSECTACHGGGHSPQRDLYSGIGGKGVAPMPDVMYQAGVRCEGCHLDHGDGETKLAGDVSCMNCHGPKYRGIYLGWVETVEQRTSGVRRQFDSTTRRLGVDLSADLADARDNLRLVERGKGIHNVRYSLAVLAAAHGQINAARQEHGLGTLQEPWPTAPYESPCLECHAGVESSSGRVFGRTFRHQTHVVDQSIECQSCHSTHEERDATGVAALKLGFPDCTSCHHGPSSGECTSCHGSVFERTFAVELGEFEHSLHVEGMEIECATCHGERPALRRRPGAEVCSDCH